MSSIKPGIDPGAQPQRDWYAVEKAEHVRHKPGEEEMKEPPRKSPETILAGAFAAFLKRIFILLSTIKPRGQAVVLSTLSDLAAYLEKFKENLILLSREDQSFNPEFVHNLALSWHALVEAVRMMDILERKRKTEVWALQSLVKDIGDYPPKEDHTLGFYMVDFIGKEWLPFPFVELLSSLHADFQVMKEKSTLASWIAAINQIIRPLSS